MGFLGKIKGLFVQKKVQEKKEVSLDEFETWLKELKEIKMRTVNDELRNYRPRIEEQKKLILESINKLKNAKLMNPNIPTRAFSLMQGNREAYMRFTSKLAEGVSIPEKYEDLEYFIAKFDNDFNDLKKSTARSFYILQEFFANEAKQIAGNIGAMEDIVNELREFVRKEGFDIINRITHKIMCIRKAQSGRKEYEDKLNELDALLREEQKKKSDAEKEIIKIKESQNFKKYLEIEQKKAAVLERTKESEAEIHHFFANIESALKKYERIALDDGELVRKYLHDSVSALKEDEGLKVLEVLSKMRNAIEHNAVELKDAKKTKTQEILNAENKESLEQMKKAIEGFRKEEKAINEEMAKYDQNAEISKQLEIQKAASVKSNDLMQRMTEIKTEREKIDINSHKEKAQQLMRELDLAEIILKI